MAWSTTAVAGIWVTCLAALFLAVGFSIPFWISTVSEDVQVTATDTKTFNTYIGVWYVMACIKGEADSCKTGAVEPDYSKSDLDGKINGTSQEAIVSSAQLYLGSEVWWWVIQIVTTVGLGFVLLATLILICCRCAGIHSKGFFIISGILEFFGGLLAVTISILTAVGIDQYFDFIAEVDIKAETFPWSVLCFGIGGLLSLLGAAIIMYVTCKWRELGKYYDSGDEEAEELRERPMSDLSKSYDRPRKYDNSNRDYDYDRRYDKSRDFSSSKKYRDTGRDYQRDYSSRDYPSRDYSRNNAGYDYSNDRNNSNGGYNKSYENGYDRHDNRGYTSSRPSENMYRPFEQYRY